MLTTQSIRGISSAILLFGAITVGAHSVMAAEATKGCDAISSAIGTSVAGTTLYQKLRNAMTDGATLGKGLPLHQWGTIVDRNGVVCAVVTTSGSPPNLNAQWLGSRVISAQKANTANAFSVDSLALSTANLWAATQPGGSLFGLQFSNAVDTSVAYGDNANCSKPGCDNSNIAPHYGQSDDPMVGHYIGGVNVFGGGLALYDSSGKLIGGLGTSGNTSCADHYISWVVRYRVNLDNVRAGVADGGADDNIIFDITGGPGSTVSASGFGHPLCGSDKDESHYPSELTKQYPKGAAPPSS
jgi:uncharacterized protein GlcG (DUF336 family)